jgi:hypothetical protein
MSHYTSRLISAVAVGAFLRLDSRRVNYCCTRFADSGIRRFGATATSVGMPPTSFPGSRQVSAMRANGPGETDGRFSSIGVDSWGTDSVERDSFREEQLLQSLLVVERGMHAQI